MDEQPVKKKTSPWVWVGVGCLALIVLIVGGVMVGGFMLVRAGKSMAAEMTDPRARAAKVHKILGAEMLPEGYHPGFALSLGPLMEVAMLTDRKPKEDGSVQGFDKHGFLYMRFPRTGDQIIRMVLHEQFRRRRVFVRQSATIDLISLRERTSTPF